jgi:hypothetical protein
VIRLSEQGWQFWKGGTWRTLKDPLEEATPSQLARLNREGRLVVVERAETISKLAAARFIDEGPA